MTILTLLDPVLTPPAYIDAGWADTNNTNLRSVLNGGLDHTNFTGAAGITASKIAGYPALVSRYLRGDGTWAATQTNVRSTTTQTVSNVVAADVATLSVLGNTIGAAVMVKVQAWGTYINNTGSNQSVVIRTNFNGNVLASVTVPTAGSSNTNWPWNITWMIENQGATNAQQHGGLMVVVGAGGNGTVILGSTAVDTTGTTQVRVTFSFGISSAFLGASCKGIIAEIL